MTRAVVRAREPRASAPPRRKVARGSLACTARGEGGVT
jgi:hypothetical protein